MSFEEFYETWWLDHENNVLAPTPKEAMRQAWLAGRKAEKAAQQSVQADGATPCDNCGTIGVHDCSEPDNHPAIPPRR